MGTLGDVGISQLFAAAAVSRRTTTTRWLGDTFARIFWYCGSSFCCRAGADRGNGVSLDFCCRAVSWSTLMEPLALLHSLSVSVLWVNGSFSCLIISSLPLLQCVVPCWLVDSDRRQLCMHVTCGSGSSSSSSSGGSVGRSVGSWKSSPSAYLFPGQHIIFYQLLLLLLLLR